MLDFLCSVAINAFGGSYFHTHACNSSSVWRVAAQGVQVGGRRASVGVEMGAFRRSSGNRHSLRNGGWVRDGACEWSVLSAGEASAGESSR